MTGKESKIPKKFVDYNMFKPSSKLFLVKVSKTVSADKLGSANLSLNCRHVSDDHNDEDDKRPKFDPVTKLDVSVKDFECCPNPTVSRFRIITKKDEILKLVNCRLSGLITVNSGLADEKQGTEVILKRKQLLPVEDLIKEASQPERIKMLPEPSPVKKRKKHKKDRHKSSEVDTEACGHPENGIDEQIGNLAVMEEALEEPSENESVLLLSPKKGKKRKRRETEPIEESAIASDTAQSDPCSPVKKKKKHKKHKTDDKPMLEEEDDDERTQSPEKKRRKKKADDETKALADVPFESVYETDQSSERHHKKSKKKRVNEESEVEQIVPEDLIFADDDEAISSKASKKEKKKKEKSALKYDECVEIGKTYTETMTDSTEVVSERKKKHKKKKKKERSETESDFLSDATAVIALDVPSESSIDVHKKKRKKRKTEDIPSTSVVNEDEYQKKTKHVTKQKKSVVDSDSQIESMLESLPEEDNRLVKSSSKTKRKKRKSESKSD